MNKIKFLSGISWKRLSSTQKSQRFKTLSVINEMRKGTSLTRASSKYGISFNTAKKHLGKFILKKNGRFFAKNFDRIQREMQIYSKGTIKSITVTKSRDAKIIGKYFNAVKKFLETRDTSVLKPFKKIKIKDAEGKIHKLETNPERILEIEDMKESSEFFEIYSDDDYA